MEEFPDRENEDDNDVLITRQDIHNVGHKKCDMSTAIWVTLDVNGRPVKMEVDTGSAISLLPTADYHKFFPVEKKSCNQQR